MLGGTTSEELNNPFANNGNGKPFPLQRSMSAPAIAEHVRIIIFYKQIKFNSIKGF